MVDCMDGGRVRQQTETGKQDPRLFSTDPLEEQTLSDEVRGIKAAKDVMAIVEQDALASPELCEIFNGEASTRMAEAFIEQLRTEVNKFVERHSEEERQTLYEQQGRDHRV